MMEGFFANFLLKRRKRIAMGFHLFMHSLFINNCKGMHASSKPSTLHLGLPMEPELAGMDQEKDLRICSCY